MQQFQLLAGIKVCEQLVVEGSAVLIDGSQAETVRGLQVLVRAAELAVDIVHYSGPRGPGILVRRNDLIGDCGERPSLIDAEKAPWSAVAAARHSRSRGGCGRESRLQKGAAIESEARHPVHWLGL